MPFFVLKQATAPFHQALEEALPFPSTLDAYRARLEWYFGYLQPWEAAVAAAAGPLSEVYREREKTPWLLADLAALGVSNVRDLPRCHSLPPLSSLPQIVGSIYVWEGSMLGAATLSKWAHDRFGLLPGSGARFLTGYGSATPARWGAFRLQLENQLRTHQPEVIASAKETFASVLNWARTSTRHAVVS